MRAKERNEKCSLKLVEHQRINVGSKACAARDQERPEVKRNQMGTVHKVTSHQAAFLRVSNCEEKNKTCGISSPKKFLFLKKKNLINIRLKWTRSIPIGTLNLAVISLSSGFKLMKESGIEELSSTAENSY